jgi:hypothetical protein
MPTVFVQTAVLNLRTGPGTTYALMGAVVEGDVLPILGKVPATAETFGWWQVDTIAGPAWLSGEHVQAAGPLDSVPLVESQAANAELLSPGPEGTAPEQPAANGLRLTIDGTSIILRPTTGSR